MTDLDRLLVADISRAAAEAAQPPEFSTIERRGTQRRRNHTVLTAAAAAVVAVLTVGVVATSQSRDQYEQLPAENPSPSRAETTKPPASTTDWTDQLRADSSGRVLTMNRERDGQDAAFGAIDILDVSATRRPGWTLELRAEPPLASSLDPAERIIQHGVVVDNDGDRVADCHVGINTDAPRPGHLRVWVQDLTTGVTDERVGPPYGIPVDFAHPSEGEPGVSGRFVHFFFLSPSSAPCYGFSPEATFYVYGLVIDQGRITARDYAPDSAWLRFP